MPSLLDELVAADAQGERMLASLWPGDQFYFRGGFHTIFKMQLDPDRMLHVLCDPIGEPHLVAGKMHQPRRHFLLGAELLFPAMLSQEHFDDENPGQGW